TVIRASGLRPCTISFAHDDSGTKVQVEAAAPTPAGGALSRAIFAVLLVFFGTSCAFVQSPMGAETAAPVHIPDEMDTTWNSFHVHLDPTILVWGEQTRVDVRAVVVGALQKVEGELKGSPAQIHVQAGSVWAIPNVG